MNFLKRRSKSRNLIVINEKCSSQALPTCTERKSSDTSLDEMKVDLFYSAQPGKAKMIPIPTPPPSPPKSKSMSCKLQSQPTTPLTSSFHTEFPCTAAPPSPPCSPWRKAKVADESVPDRSSKLSMTSGPLSPQSLIIAVSAKLDSSVNGDTSSK